MAPGAPFWLNEGPMRSLYLPVMQSVLQEAVDRTQDFPVTHLMALHSDLRANTKQISQSVPLDPQVVKAVSSSKRA